ncbi:MAG: transcriptional regulator [Coriobacteriaceae bacterium]|nr:transcriptional regulator [Coriobacteriaceae bacterium]
MREPSDNAIEAAESIFIGHGGVMRTGEALAAGIHRRTFYWMRDRGRLEALSRGVFILASAPLPASPDVAAVMRRVPKAVLCLVSALEFHGIGTQIPSAVQIALPRNVRPPKIDHPRVQVFNMSESAFRAGVEQRSMAGTEVRVFGVAKTIADCFRYRARIGLDVALEALQEVVRQRTVTPAEIMEFARVDTVETVIEPYLRALL